MKCIEILNRSGLTKTPCRVDVLNALTGSNTALSEQELRKKLTFDFDRTTVFRTIRSFVDAGIIHAISCGDIMRYAMNPGKRSAQHAHFTCKKCGGVSCISSVHPGRYNMPKGFTSHGIALMINGVCDHCNRAK